MRLAGVRLYPGVAVDVPPPLAEQLLSEEGWSESAYPPSPSAVAAVDTALEDLSELLATKPKRRKRKSGSKSAEPEE